MELLGFWFGLGLGFFRVEKTGQSRCRNFKQLATPPLQPGAEGNERKCALLAVSFNCPLDTTQHHMGRGSQ